MRILFLIDNLRPGGAQKALLGLCQSLKPRGMTPSVWCLGGTSEFEERFRAAGVPVLGARGRWWLMPWQPVTLTWHLWRHRIDLLQTLLFHSDVTGRVAGRIARLLRRGRGRPVIVSSVRASNVRNRRWQYFLARTTAPLADAFTSVSQRTAEFAAQHEGVARDRTTVIPNGIDPVDWAERPAGGPVREAMGIPRDAFVAVTLSRFTEQKGHEYLLRAAATVVARQPNAFFVLAGYGPLEDALKSLARELGIESHVKFPGYRSDVTALLAAGDIFVLPSLWEGMSNAVLEAMAAGKPVVATSVDGNVEQVIPGQTGILVPPADSGALAEAILALARNAQGVDDMGRKGRERVEKEFSMARMVDQYEALYRRLVKED